jgi:ketosteroid isomerase-like protein
MDERALQELIDRQQITDVLLRYASSIDLKDHETLRATLTDDSVAEYPPSDPIVGGDAITAWITQMTEGSKWQHHFLNVYHVDIDGDEARTLTYHTSHQTTFDDPDTVLVIVARYRDIVRRVDGVWKIADKRMEIGWMEQRHHPQSEITDATLAEQGAARARSESVR